MGLAGRSLPGTNLLYLRMGEEREEGAVPISSSNEKPRVCVSVGRGERCQVLFLYSLSGHQLPVGARRVWGSCLGTWA